jgi:hypothetical protein
LLQLPAPHTDGAGTYDNNLPVGFEEPANLASDAANVGGVDSAVFGQDIRADFYYYPFGVGEISHNLPLVFHI